MSKAKKKVNRNARQQDRLRPELGAASLKIDLIRSVITVRHGEDREILAQGKVKMGAWNALWSVLDVVGCKRVRRDA